MAEPSSPTGLNATSASLLGLLAIDDWPRPWTSYELAKQAGRSLHWFWPRAQRRLYAVPARLVALGYAQAHDHATGRRASTRYVITQGGRAALRAWLDESGPGVWIESEDLIRVFFADHGDVAQLREAISRIATNAAHDRVELARIVAHMDRTRHTSRDAVNALSIRLVADVQDAVERWAAWALEQSAPWRDPRDPWPGASEVFARVLERAAAAEEGRMQAARGESAG